MESNQPEEGAWPAKLLSWEIVEVEQIGQLKLVLWFDVHGDGWKKTMKWDEFFLKKDGTQNKKTYKTLKALGFASSDIGDLLKDDALDKEPTYTVTVESEVQDGNTYWRVQWVNTDHESKGAIKDKAVLKGHNLAKLNSYLGPAKPKNYAPQSATTAPPQMDTDSDIDNFLNS